jgi:hypothetical protein
MKSTKVHVLNTIDLCFASNEDVTGIPDEHDVSTLVQKAGSSEYLNSRSLLEDMCLLWISEYTGTDVSSLTACCRELSVSKKASLLPQKWKNKTKEEDRTV